MSATTIITRSDLRLRRNRRRLSTPNARQPARIHLCHSRSLPHSLEALDLSTESPTQTLASLRFLVLSYLSDLENHLSQLESPLSEFGAWKAKGELTIEEARAWAHTALEMLDSIRNDVCSHLPEFHFADISVENLKSHLPDMPDVLGLNDMRSHLPDMPDVRSRLPDMNDVRAHLPDFADMRSKLDDVRTRFSDIDFQQPLSYIPTLSDHLQNLHSHLSSMELPSKFGMPSFAPSSVLSDLLDTLLSSELVTELLTPSEGSESGEDMFERAAKEVANAVKRSLEGVHLIQYSDLPQQWRNNPFVRQGYRFIPLERWPLIIMSIFAFHNETLNIHTHLIPFMFWGLNSIPFLNPSSLSDTPEVLFTAFSLLCLLGSTIWHTMAGCAHSPSMEFCARVDYVGIGWLISASVGTIVHYGYQCSPNVGNSFLVLCFLTGLAGNICPFMDWFNQFEYRLYRIAFFLTLAFSAVAPLAGLAILHSTSEMFAFISPVVPSLVSYVTGLVFYASHVPERFLPEKWCHKLDIIGGGSHCIWHCFIVLAVSQHKAAIRTMRGGIECVSGF